MKKQTVTISTLEDSDCLPEELGEFLFLLKGAYCAAEFFDKSPFARTNNASIGTPIDEFRFFAERLSPLEIDNVFHADLGGGQLVVKRIVRASPWEFIIYGIAGSLSLAVIFSGGKVKIGKGLLEFELASIGEGIKNLRAGLGLGEKVTAGFSVETATIKLSRAEFDELRRVSPTAKNRGGFQSFLVSLQSKVNKNTLKIELSHTDLARIKKYMADPKSGGFQSRFHKIFGSHFPKNN